MDRLRSNNRQSGILRQLLPVAGVLLLCLLISAAILTYGARSSAEQEARQYGQSLARSTAILIQPLLLADDRISLNYLFNELNAQPRVNGLNLVDSRKLPVAVAGEQRGLEQTLELARGDETLGELKVWIDPDYGWELLKKQLLESGLLALVSMLAALLTLWLRLRPKTESEPERSDFAQVASAVSPALAQPLPSRPLDEEDPDALPRLDDDNEFDSTREQAARVRVEEDDYDLPSPEEDTGLETENELELSMGGRFEPDGDDTDNDEGFEAPFEKNTDADEPEHELAPEVDTWLRTTEDYDSDETMDELVISAVRDNGETPYTEASAANGEEPSDNNIEEADSTPVGDDNRELVELLRPSRTQERMPPFTPSVRDPDSDEAIAPDMDDSDQVEFDDGGDDADEVAQSEPTRPRLSIVPPLGSHEEQLGLYTLEHELELMLNADDAGYLFLIDAGSAHSENLEEDERIQLMKPYRTLANSVAHIYGGRVEPTREGDLQLFFDTPKENDGHGINALCASMLFTYLYRHYNQHRIRQFKPVINLHQALVRGHHQKLERMLEEARFLTRTTESNELITHTALTEAPDLKATLLEGADIRREDEDKVLLIRIAKSYQELLEKQARHLLAKLQSREEQAGG